ncbi:hypothetical protein [Microbacterium sp. No. 7]|uniref:hypothetical protein n=1 Tax=Microbacterium sp. No. 7 TaxID=1714373 RepID=UPI000ABD58F2|nr:hypothetical protein [Microbacterium sp. No. 7]
MTEPTQRLVAVIKPDERGRFGLKKFVAPAAAPAPWNVYRNADGTRIVLEAVPE